MHLYNKYGPCITSTLVYSFWPTDERTNEQQTRLLTYSLPYKSFSQLKKLTKDNTEFSLLLAGLRHNHHNRRTKRLVGNSNLRFLSITTPPFDLYNMSSRLPSGGAPRLSTAPSSSTKPRQLVWHSSLSTLDAFKYYFAPLPPNLSFLIQNTAFDSLD